MSESMHRDHDLDLVSALAQGRLTDPGPAEDLVASCPECADLYHSHRAVLDAAGEEPEPRLDDLERARLHASVWEEIGRGGVPAAAPASSPWWYRLAPVAAALVVAIGLVTYLNSGQQAVLQMGGEETSATTEAAADRATEMAPMADAPAADDQAESYLVPDTTAAGDGDGSAVTEAGTGGPADLTREELATALEEFRTRVAADEYQDEAEEAGDTDFRCDPPTEAGDLLALDSVRVEDERVWLAVYGTPTDVGPAAAFRRSDCQLLLVDR